MIGLQPTVRLPTCFHREYGSRVDEFIMLRDPKNNEIEVMIEKRDRKVDNKCKKVYFKHGWFGLRDFYRLDLGAWIDLTYESPSLMLMTVKNRFNEEVVYTECNPPIVARLNRRVCSGSRIIFKWTDMIRLAPSDVHSGYLVSMCDVLICVYAVFLNVCNSYAYHINCYGYRAVCDVHRRCFHPLDFAETGSRPMMLILLLSITWDLNGSATSSLSNIIYPSAAGLVVSGGCCARHVVWLRGAIWSWLLPMTTIMTSSI